MKMRWSIAVLVGCCLVGGCHRETSIPSGSFRLTVQEVVSDTDVRVSLLTVELSDAATISVDHGGSHNHILLPDAQDSVVRVGQVLLSAARIAPAQDKSAYIQTLIRPRTLSGFAGGAELYTVPGDTTLASFFSISAASGIYKLNTPVTIAQLQGKPVVLAVGKPTR
jgi:hypothetical protein